MYVRRVCVCICVIMCGGRVNNSDDTNIAVDAFDQWVSLYQAPHLVEFISDM